MTSEIHTVSRASSPVGKPGTPQSPAEQDPSHGEVMREEQESELRDALYPLWKRKEKRVLETGLREPGDFDERSCQAVRAIVLECQPSLWELCYEPAS